jgi:hypothetical protein
MPKWTYHTSDLHRWMHGVSTAYTFYMEKNQWRRRRGSSLGCSMGGGRRRQLAPPVKMTGISCNPSATHAPQRAPPAGHDTVGLLVLVPNERRSRNYGAAMCRSRRSRRDAEKPCVAAMRRPQRRPPQEALRFARRRRGWLNRRRR